ncbi:hypothetical protein ATCVMO0605SPH_644R [Acanthocystis turfacea Chlorella virus MO0605SPH]|nr:hypothetical protein ATCVMO0605SPH_644R [Acanthocystis turfacea Chlorella virus MO0605SPH]AGE57743.1 hypothetical protein ATCVNTS1_702R [Acanthocystis turfacea Chlorella virus NTS-1]
MICVSQDGDKVVHGKAAQILNLVNEVVYLPEIVLPGCNHCP